MISDFEAADGIYIVQGKHQLDLHNNFAFEEVRYSVVDRTVSLRWTRRPEDWVPPDSPATIRLTFEGVLEFRFVGRDPKMPITEDDCLHTMGYLTDEAWSKGNVVETKKPEPDWLTAFAFQSGAVIAVRAERATAQIG